VARLDVHRNLARGDAPFLLDVQANLLSSLRTRLVIPLLPLAHKRDRIPQLHLLAGIEGVSYVLATDYMAAVDRRQLGAVVGSLDKRHHEITAAIDFLLQGF
jgi:toxin CcdB